MRVFISHSSEDKKFVRYLKQCLNLNGINTWFDEDQLLLGDSLEKKLKTSIEKSTHFLIVLSTSSVASKWVSQELNIAMTNLDAGIIEKIIPVKLMECEIPSFLDELAYFNLSEAIRLPKQDIVEFLDDTFNQFFIKLVKTLRAPNSSMMPSEKSQILKSIVVNSNYDNEFQGGHLFLDQVERAIIDYNNSAETNGRKVSIVEIAKFLKNQNVIRGTSESALRQQFYILKQKNRNELNKLLNDSKNDDKWIETRKAGVFKSVDNL